VHGGWSCTAFFCDPFVTPPVCDTKDASMTLTLSRRAFIGSAGALGSVALAGDLKAVDAVSEPLPVAAVVTTYTRNSHADVILGKILSGWRQDGGAGPALRLVSLYVDQVGAGDLSADLAKQYGFKRTQSIAEAVTLGKATLPVAGVISIGEHGDYPLTEVTQQRQYPRRRFFDEIVAAMQRCGTFAPIFNDKHLGYRWQDAKHMYDTSAQHQIPLLAGSSLPVAWRYPAKLLPPESVIDEALVIGYGGHEAYGFHALEALQSIVERRRGGETGVAAVTTLRGQQILEAAGQGRWSVDLLRAAAASAKQKMKPLEQHVNEGSALFVIEYRDGMRATVAMLKGFGETFAAACRLRGEAQPFRAWFRLEYERPYGHFEHLVRAIESMLHTKMPPYAVERTLLTTGILDRAMQSRTQPGTRLQTPELQIAYQSSNWPFANQHGENFPQAPQDEPSKPTR